LGGIEYSGPNLEAIYHSEGRITPNGTTAFFYEYTIKDHLGNARVNFRANGAAITFLEELHYYPFGLLMEGIGTAATTQNKYRYNGKELNDDFGLNLSDYGARWYDAALGRWWSVDPLAEKTPRWSSYHYGFDNPLRFVDPNGMESEAFGPNYSQKFSEQYEQGQQQRQAGSTRPKSGGSTFGADGSAHLEGADAGNWAAGQQRAKDNQLYQSFIMSYQSPTFGQYPQKYNPQTQKNYGAAINVIRNVTDGISSNYTIDYNEDYGSMMVTAGDLKEGAIQIITLSSHYIDYAATSPRIFEAFLRAFIHEVIHVYQRSGYNVMTDKNEREFLAYHFQALPNSENNVLFQRMKTDENFKWNYQFSEKFLPEEKYYEYSLGYYNKMSIDKQKKYKKSINEIKNAEK